MTHYDGYHIEPWRLINYTLLKLWPNSAQQTRGQSYWRDHFTNAFSKSNLMKISFGYQSNLGYIISTNVPHVKTVQLLDHFHKCVIINLSKFGWEQHARTNGIWIRMDKSLVKWFILITHQRYFIMYKICDGVLWFLWNLTGLLVTLILNPYPLSRLYWWVCAKKMYLHC